MRTAALRTGRAGYGRRRIYRSVDESAAAAAAGRRHAGLRGVRSRAASPAGRGAAPRGVRRRAGRRGSLAPAATLRARPRALPDTIS